MEKGERKKLVIIEKDNVIHVIPVGPLGDARGLQKGWIQRD